MARIDPEQERRRLIDFYSGQLDGELEKVASQAYELTDLAREALRSELVRRGLNAELVGIAPAVKNVVAGRDLPGDPRPPMPPRTEAAFDSEGELRELVTIRRFRDLPEALLAKGSLESAGIEALLGDDNVIRLDWFWSNLIGGVKLQVDPEDADVASRILDQPIPEGFDVAGVGEYHQPRCPRCQSLDVSPIPWKRRAWNCYACKAEWEGSDDQGADEGRPGDDRTGGSQPD
jgi:hypothetical protein